MKRRWHIFISLVIIFIVLQACNLPGGGNSNTEPTKEAPEVDVEKTEESLEARETEVAEKATKNAIPPTLPPTEAPTYTPYPTYTTQPVVEATNPPAPTVEVKVDMSEKIKDANILVFEDVRGFYDLAPWVTRVTQSMSLNHVTNVGDALGNFQKEIYSPTKWDLIIISVEVRTNFSGEMFDGVIDRLNDGAAVIVELWHLDQIANGRIAPLMSKCGVSFQRNWERPYNYDPLDYSMYWLETSSPIISSPNMVDPLYSSTNYWFTDAGDQIKLASGGSATMLAGLYPKEKSSYGTLASCVDGRMIFQTFSTHDYKYEQMIPLWENYIVNTLTAHFNYVK